LVLCALCFFLFVPILLAALCLLALTEGRPFFYVSERMHSATRGFALIKLRTMRESADNTGVTGGDKSGRISPIYRFLRKTRIDEIPQLWNVLRGDMTFVGPRPPLRLYVEAFPEIYAEVLKSRPGLTGLATLRFHANEEKLLAQTQNAAETDAVYRRRCVPRKARLDLIYQQNRSLCFDAAILWQTGARLFRK